MAKMFLLAGVLLASACCVLAEDAGSGGLTLDSTSCAVEVLVDEDAAALEALLKEMDARAAEIRTLSADITITNRENFSGRESTRSGKLYLRKPGELFLDLVEKTYPRKIWILPDRLVEYNPDLGTAHVMELDSEAGADKGVIGLDTTSEQLRDGFYVSLGASDDESVHLLQLVPKVARTDFSSAGVTLDAGTLLPVKVVQENADLDETKTFVLTNVRENPRLRDGLFEPNLPRGTSIETFEGESWRGP